MAQLMTLTGCHNTIKRPPNTGRFDDRMANGGCFSFYRGSFNYLLNHASSKLLTKQSADKLKFCQNSYLESQLGGVLSGMRFLRTIRKTPTVHYGFVFLEELEIESTVLET